MVTERKVLIESYDNGAAWCRYQRVAVVEALAGPERRGKPVDRHGGSVYKGGSSPAGSAAVHGLFGPGVPAAQGGRA
jgi:hypothetical protein